KKYLEALRVRTSQYIRVPQGASAVHCPDRLKWSYQERLTVIGRPQKTAPQPLPFPLPSGILLHKARGYHVFEFVHFSRVILPEGIYPYIHLASQCHMRLLDRPTMTCVKSKEVTGRYVKVFKTKPHQLVEVVVCDGRGAVTVLARQDACVWGVSTEWEANVPN